jgi:hypothetical protein
MNVLNSRVMIIQYIFTLHVQDHFFITGRSTVIMGFCRSLKYCSFLFTYMKNLLQWIFSYPERSSTLLSDWQHLSVIHNLHTLIFYVSISDVKVLGHDILHIDIYRLSGRHTMKSFLNSLLFLRYPFFLYIPSM